MKDITNMSFTANVGVVTPDCSGSGNPSCMVSLSPAIVGGYINSRDGVPVFFNVTGMDTDPIYTVTLDSPGENNIHLSMFKISNSGLL